MHSLQTQPAVAATAPARLSLEARLAAAEAAMTVRLDVAAVGFEVNTAHIPGQPVDLADIVRGPVPVPDRTPAPYPTPVAAVLQAAQQVLAARGWCVGQFTTPDGAHCLRGAIRAAAGGDQSLEDRAVDLLLQAIRRRCAADTVAAWNDAQHDGRTPIRVLGDAAAMADVRGL